MQKEEAKTCMMESACHVCHNLLQHMNGGGDRRFQKGRGKKCVEKVVAPA
jgi:hypothetical protein